MFFDTHADIWTDILHSHENGTVRRLRDFHFPRMRKGGMGGGIFVIWIDPPHDAHPQKRMLQAIQTMCAELYESRDIVQLVRDFSDFGKARKEGKLAVVAGLEGLSGLYCSPEWLYALHAMGFRHASLTWNEENCMATGARGSASRGLTPKGRKALDIMEDLGIIVDVSHSNEKTFWDIYDHTGKVLIASHSNCKALCDNRRNLSDEQLKAIAKRGGIVGVVAYNAFIHDSPEKQNIQGLADHVDHMAKVMGVEHVAFGFDFGDYLNAETLHYFQEGEIYGPEGIENVEAVPAFIDELKRRGYSQDELENMCFGNALRVFKEVLPAGGQGAEPIGMPQESFVK